MLRRSDGRAGVAAVLSAALAVFDVDVERALHEATVPLVSVQAGLADEGAGADVTPLSVDCTRLRTIHQ